MFLVDFESVYITLDCCFLNRKNKIKRNLKSILFIVFVYGFLV